MFRKFPGSIPGIPLKYKDDFWNIVIGENYTRLIVASVILIIIESIILAFFKGRLLNTEIVSLAIIIINIVFLSGFYFLNKKRNVLGLSAGRISQAIYLFLMLVLGCTMSLVPQNKFGSINVYIMVLFSISAFIIVQPVLYFFILLFVYIIFFLALPFYQPDSNAVLILRINALAMNAFAWIFSRMVFRMRINSFLDKKTIEEKNIRLKDFSIRDSMTYLLNHDHSLKRLRDEIRRVSENSSQLSVIMADIDHFKNINDKYGHATGDKIIRGLSEILMTVCRTTDILGRYGGEEFIVILPFARLKDASVIAERIRGAVESYNFPNGIRVTVSAGVTEFEGESPEELVVKVDKMLYLAKENGRNRVQY